MLQFVHAEKQVGSAEFRKVRGEKFRKSVGSNNSKRATRTRTIASENKFRK
jgi:hypothetical protein